MPIEPTPEALSLTSYAVLSNVGIGVLAELDHRKISFAELLRLEVGSVLVLNRPLGENIDVYVDRVLLGTAEVLVVDESLAVRLADLRDKPSVTQNADQLAKLAQIAT